MPAPNFYTLATPNYAEQAVPEKLKALYGLDRIPAVTDKLSELGLDSLDIVELTIEMEDQFCITISDTQVEMISTVGDLIHAVKTAKSQEQ